MSISYKKEEWLKKMKAEMREHFGIKNDLALPKITKVVINTGIGRLVVASKNSQELIEKISKELALITGQKPSFRTAKKSISSFKTREGMTIGLKITLRGKRMEDFIFKFINLVLPRIRDFWGIPLTHIDEKGNLNYGIKEHNVFLESNKEQNIPPFGLEVSFSVKAKNREQAIKLYQAWGFPLRQEDEK
ncbi:MAG: 50S ribosomal protein L5 [Candidatus Paceibacterota bacterium]|jgi:large subunit ribosomal protein L5|nr:50S ribosomal protein L5 [Candidatus Paceibacterota bacterium]MDD3548526.1 50S ribosomal protein L5 [Candidatus Paceibacterota bacterium]MDD4999069.1 50S ribosomal protein L5 [Candidatus Paceibacterota bacterium]MDD5545230.1 50S ribosomal protein L5 [Candidatus Paceibacterota bacterium]